MLVNSDLLVQAIKGCLPHVETTATTAEDTIQKLARSNHGFYDDVSLAGVRRLFYLAAESHPVLVETFRATTFDVMLQAVAASPSMFSPPAEGSSFIPPMALLVPPGLRQHLRCSTQAADRSLHLSAVQVFTILSAALILGRPVPQLMEETSFSIQCRFVDFFGKQRKKSGHGGPQEGGPLDRRSTKLVCFIDYFNRSAQLISGALQVLASVPDGDLWKEGAVPDESAQWKVSRAIRVLSFIRSYTPELTTSRLPRDARPLVPLEIKDHGARIEDHRGVQADFAARNIGGGILGSGSVQEEIRFSISPELIVCQALESPLMPGDTVTVVGSLKVCDYTGYAASFRHSPLRPDGIETFQALDEPPPSEEARIFQKTPNQTPPILQMRTAVGVINAQSYSRSGPKEQYTEANMLTQVRKVTSLLRADLGDAQLNGLPYVTGNWGCGVFAGDVQLKALLQWMGASTCQRAIVYCPFDETILPQRLPKIVDALLSRKTTVGKLWSWLIANSTRFDRPDKRHPSNVFSLIEKDMDRFFG